MRRDRNLCIPESRMIVWSKTSRGPQEVEGPAVPCTSCTYDSNATDGHQCMHLHSLGSIILNCSVLASVVSKSLCGGNRWKIM